MKNHLRNLLIAGLAGCAGLGADAAQAQYGYPGMPGMPGGRPYTAQMVPGYANAMQPGPMMPPPQMQYPPQARPAAYAPPAPEPDQLQAPSKSDGYEDCGTCDDGCDTFCCSGVAEHRTGAFADFLYLRPRDAEITYGVPFNGPVTAPDPTVQVGPAGVLDPDFAPGYRLGVVLALDSCSSLAVTYTDFESSTFDSINVNQSTIPNVNNVIRSNLIHPNTVTAGFGSQFTSANGNYDVDFQTLDLDYRAVWFSGPRHVVNYVIGARYGKLEENLSVRYINPGTMTVLSNTNFEGVGLKLGLDGEKHHARSGLFGYGRGNVAMLGGDARGSYLQTDSFAGPLVNTSWEAGRLVTTLDLELGVGWQNECGNFRLMAGYMYNGWYNAIGTDEFIDAVQTNDWVNLGGTKNNGTTFDGLTARVELRF